MALIAQGSFVSTAAARVVEMPQQPDYFVITNRSTWATAPTAVVKSEWYRGLAAGAAYTWTEGGASALTATRTVAGGLGFTLIDTSSQAPGPLVATGTAVSQAGAAVVTDASTPAVGTIVRMLNTTGMLQIAGMEFEVTALNPGVTFTLGYLNSAGFGAAATNADYRILPPQYWRPSRKFITGITAANPAVVTTSVAHGYAIGDKVGIYVPTAFGMSQINGMTATITAVTVSTFTTDINAAAFTAFAFPTSAIAALGVSFAHVVPVGEVATQLTAAERNIAVYGMYLDTAVVGANTNIMDWMAFKADFRS